MDSYGRNRELASPGSIKSYRGSVAPRTPKNDFIGFVNVILTPAERRRLVRVTAARRRLGEPPVGVDPVRWIADQTDDRDLEKWVKELKRRQHAHEPLVSGE
jgi:hypothetical protein